MSGWERDISLNRGCSSTSFSNIKTKKVLITDMIDIVPLYFQWEDNKTLISYDKYLVN